ncbi:unnamed protein product [Ambrosiozyma monospora]|uniref:Unnamed protein product n=1 Tax=Ambrosiozyma monospora TaxID=43982 RepID=A0ACB5U179_AMBMO|nr:unnamed protein product [Ambrosiozyma monospora]
MFHRSIECDFQQQRYHDYFHPYQHIYETHPFPSTTELYLGLANQCDYVTIIDSDMHSDTLNDIKWLNKITCLSELSICIRRKSGVVLSLLNIGEELPKISNVKDLKNLKLVRFNFNIHRAFSHPFERIQSSINRLPSTVTRLKIDESNKRQLLFESLSGLESLDMSYSFVSSSLPSLRKLEPGTSNADEKTLDGFASCVSSSPLHDTLESPSIRFGKYTKIQPSHFWHAFIQPLDGLLGLAINNYCLSSDLLIDEYPSSLVSLKIVFRNDYDAFDTPLDGRMILHVFGKTLRYFRMEGVEGSITLE